MSSDKTTKSLKKGKRSRTEQIDAEAEAVVPTAEGADELSLESATKTADATMDDTDSFKPAKDDKKRKNKSSEPASKNEEIEEDDTPALSHKEKRLAKRRKLAGLPERAPASNTTVGAFSSNNDNVMRIGDQPPLVAPAVGNTPAKSAHGIWVGNLNFATTSKELIAWFGDRGLTEVTRINMPNGKRAHENNRGFAYIDFPSATDVEIAVGLSEQHLDGRKLLIKDSSDFTGRPIATTAPLTVASVPPSALVESTQSTETSDTTPVIVGPTGNVARPIIGVAQPTLNRTARKILDRQKNPPGPTLFLGNLGFETTVEDIKELFDAHQRAMASWAPRDKKEKKLEEKAKRKAKKAAGGGESSGSEEGGSSDEEDSDDEKEKEKKSEDGEDDEEESEDAAEVEGGGEEPRKPKRVRAKKGKPETKEPLDLSKAKDAGIRKVRLGTFEDTGKCKGWAFVDFHLPEQCTRALLNIRNHTLAGRALNVEYASPDAVRRGAIGTRGAAPGVGGRGGRGGAAGRGGRSGEASSERKSRDWDDSDIRAAAEQGEWGVHPDRAARANDGSSRGGFGGRGGRGGGRGGATGGAATRGGERRAKPGAALANAQRASEGIVPSTGRKIVFE